MGTLNKGNQKIAIDYNQQLTAEEENYKLLDVVNPGVLTGLNLTRVDDTTVSISPGACLIQDSVRDLLLKVEVQDTIATQTISSGTPYIVARFTWVNVDNNYMDILNVAFGDIQETDIVIGKGVYAVTVLDTTFDYTERSIASFKNNVINTEANLLSDDTIFQEGTIINPSDEAILRKSLGREAYSDLPIIQANKSITITDSDQTLDRYSPYNRLYVSAGSADRTITLPDASLVKDRSYFIKKIDDGSGAVIINSTSGDFDGESTIELTSKNNGITVSSDGTNYFALTAASDNKQIQTEFNKQNSAGIIIPLYIYPTSIYTNTIYNNVIELAKEYRDVPIIAVINPSNGPGTVVDANYTAAIKRLQGANIKVIGYVYTDYATRSQEDVKDDIVTWKELYPRIDGIFFDEMTYQDNSTYFDYYSSINEYAKNYVQLTVGNVGSPFASGYHDNECADIIIGWESDAMPTESQLQEDFAGGAYDYALNKRAILLHSQSYFNTYDFDLLKKYYGWVYYTDDIMPNPWDTISNYLENMLRNISKKEYIPGVQSFDSGWIANSDWTNAEFTINHGLNVALPDLIVKFFISTDGTDANSFEIVDTGRAYDQATPSDVDVVYGIQIFSVDNNELEIKTGKGGLLSLNNTEGTLVKIETQSWYYRVKIYKTETLDLNSVFQAGWNSGWLDYSASNALKDVTYTITHNLGADLPDLDVRFFYSATGIDTDAQQIDNTSLDFAASFNATYGFMIKNNNSNSIILKTGADGIVYINSSGDAAAYTSGYIKIVITKKIIDSIPTVDVQSIHASYADDSGQTIPSSSPTTITWNNELSSNGISYSSGQFTIETEGWYLIQCTLTTGNVSWGSGDRFQHNININGSDEERLDSEYVDGSITRFKLINGIVVKYLSVGDEVSITGFQDTGSPLDLNTNPDSNHIQIIKIPDKFITSENKGQTTIQRDLSTSVKDVAIPSNGISGDRYTIIWKNGDPSNKGAISVPAGATLESGGVELDATAKARFMEGCGKATILKVNSTLYELESYSDSDGGNYTAGEFEKTVSGKLLEWQELSDTTDASTADMFGSTAGTYYFESQDDLPYILTQKSVPKITDSCNTPSLSGTIKILDVTISKFRVLYGRNSNAGEVNVTINSKGTWY